MNRSKFKYVVCPGSNPKSDYYHIYNEVYSCWQNLWANAYQEMKVDKKLFSDNFTRQDFIGAILYEGKCVGLACFRWSDLKSSSFSNDSSLNLWGDDDLKSITEQGSKIIICTQLAIHPLARNGNLGVSMLDLLTGISVEFFKSSNADAMAAHVRADRKVNQSCVRMGARVIRPDIHFSGGVCGDLMVFYKDNVMNREPQKLDSVFIDLWNDRLVIPKEFASQEDYFIKTKRLRKVA